MADEPVKTDTSDEILVIPTATPLSAAEAAATDATHADSFARAVREQISTALEAS